MSKGWSFFWGIVIGLLVAAAIFAGGGRGGTVRETVYDTAWETVYDTLTYVRPVARDSAVVRYETVWLPLVGNSMGKHDEACGSMGNHEEGDAGSLGRGETLGAMGSLPGGNTPGTVMNGMGASAEGDADSLMQHGAACGSMMNHGCGVDTGMVEVAVPIERKVWADSTYRIVAEGFRMRLDSVSVYPRTEYVTITKTLTETRTKTRRWGIGVQVGYGYGANGFSPYVGVGVQYNLFGF